MENISELGNNLNETVKISVEKNNGVVYYLFIKFSSIIKYNILMIK